MLWPWPKCFTVLLRGLFWHLHPAATPVLLSRRPRAAVGAPYRAASTVLHALFAKVCIWIWKRVCAAVLAAEHRIAGCVVESAAEAQKESLRSQGDAV